MRFSNKMNMAKIGIILSLIVFLTMPAAVAQTPPTIESGSYILLDADTGAVLAEYNADLRLPPASMTKIMTSYMGFRAIERGIVSPEHKVLVSERAWAQNVVGSKTFLQVNSEVSIQDLLLGIIVQSGNDASIALAEGISGDEAAFVADMNAQFAEWGLENTHFVNTTGLPDSKHYSSARDIAFLVRQTILDYPQEYKLYKKREFTYNNIRQENRNKLLSSYPGADGVKTGYTKAAGYCLAASATKNGRRLISVVMKTPSARMRARESGKLLSFGFAHFVNVNLFDDTKIRKMSIFQGVSDFVEARPTQQGVRTYPRGKEVEAVFEPVSPLLAPIAKGDVVGKIHISVDGEAADSVDVAAMEDVAEAGWAKYWLDFTKWKYLGHGHGNRLLSEW